MLFSLCVVFGTKVDEILESFIFVIAMTKCLSYYDHSDLSHFHIFATESTTDFVISAQCGVRCYFFSFSQSLKGKVFPQSAGL